MHVYRSQSRHTHRTGGNKQRIHHEMPATVERGSISNPVPMSMIMKKLTARISEGFVRRPSNRTSHTTDSGKTAPAAIQDDRPCRSENPRLPARRLPLPGDERQPEPASDKAEKVNIQVSILKSLPRIFILQQDM